MGNFLPSTDAQRREMMDVVGVQTIEELYADIPADLRKQAADATASMPAGVSEFEALEQMKHLAKKNRVFDAIFRGAGAYWHHIPAVVSRVSAKEAFVTAYTPYQPEISQGILQTIFEYQTMLCEFTGMDAANASVYDGATAAAEAAAMCRERNRNVTLLAAGLNPESIETVQTYSFGADAEVAIVPNKGGRLDLDALKAALRAGVASLILQSPNYYGVIEDVPAIAELVHAAGAKVVVSMNPTAMAL
ncbi:MAG: aminomethyl-transferring glycine dehydrogenase, partial [Coriobacteriia bacterium]|nr:aminomethyl-transferring glycine dehydrogenase [Coriobacteriia bacterium]